MSDKSKLNRDFQENPVFYRRNILILPRIPMYKAL